MTRSTLITGVVAGLAVVAVTAGVAAAVNRGTIDDRVETISVGPTDAPTDPPTASATSSFGEDDVDADETVPTEGGTDSVLPAQEVPVGVTSEEAVRIALAAVPGTLDDVELEVEDGRTVWDVDIHGADGWEYEVDVDARTGDIVEQERDDLKDDGSDDDGSDDDGLDD
ncbi:MAG: PepSY domain-containing protein [Kineosporiaceae bacterium]